MARFLLLLGLLAASVHAQSKLILTGTKALDDDDPAPTDPSLFTSYASTITVSDNSTTTETATSDTTTSTNTTSSANKTLISGGATATSTGHGPKPTNTRPCNGHARFCDRAYSNVTMVAAHNSPFVRPGSMASNQKLDVSAQLNDGVRMRGFS